MSLAIFPANAATTITLMPNKVSSFNILKKNTVTKKVVKKSSASRTKAKKSMSINSVKNLSTAKQYMAIYCPRVKVVTQKGIYSTYNPSTSTIKLGTNVSASRYNWVFAHEFGHHLQWMNMNKNVSIWNKAIKNKSLEVQGDYIAQVLTGGNASKGYYTKKKVKGSNLTTAKKVIQNGKKRGC